MNLEQKYISGVRTYKYLRIMYVATIVSTYKFEPKFCVKTV